MEKILYIRSVLRMDGRVEDGLQEVNKWLEDGWSVKMISAAPNRDSMTTYAYVVIEKR